MRALITRSRDDAQCNTGESPYCRNIFSPYDFYIQSHTCRLRESWHQSLCDVSVCAFQVFDWESFAVTVRHYCLQPKNFDSNIEASIISSTSIYFSFIKDGDDDVDTPCWIKLDVLPALEQGQGNVTQGKGLLVMSRKKKVTCNVTQVEEC